jgi:hypothetical protein
MGMKKIIIPLIIAILTTHAAGAQAIVDSSIIGIWKGTSICQVKNSPCHDEIVVYHVSKIAGRDSFSIAANKIINGAEEEMGILRFKLDRKNMQMVSTDYNSLWTFTIKGRDLDGTLYSRNALYRIIKLKKQ